MDIRELHALERLAEVQSISAVARESGISAPTAHKYLKSLERELGVALYSRKDRTLQLTPAARLLIPHVRDLLMQERAIRLAAEGWRQSKRGAVRCGAGPSFCCQILPRLIKRFHRECPGVDLFVESGNGAHLLDGLRTGTLDCVFGLPASAAGDERIQTRAVWRARAAFVAGPSIAAKRPSPAAASRLPFLAFQEGSGMDVMVRQYLADLDIRPPVVMRSDSAEVIKAMLRAGLGVSVMFLWTVAGDLRKGILKRILLGKVPMYSSMALLCTRSFTVNPSVRHFVELAQKMSWPELDLAS